jgi:hypothetical protein
MGRSLWLRDVGSLSDSRTVIETERFLYCNPCLGIPPLLVPSPRCFFAVQLAVGAIALLMLMLFPCTPVAVLVGGLP